MHVFEAIESRRAVKHFQANTPMTAAEQQQLFDLARRAPTAFNLQHWRFVVVESPALRAQIRAAAWDQAQVTDASLLLVLCADTQAWAKQPEALWAAAPQPVQDFIVPAIDGYYRDKPQVQRDEAMRSCGIVAQTLMLAARGLGYDSCPMDGFDFDKVAELIKLPEGHVISMLLAVGKQTQAPWPRGVQRDEHAVIIRDHF
ncbi:nitroreductase family protein [Atopomonas sediminilitoris]|uniref:nitroreductase family protein n=1 Tax=Atopomonas sediminilitoris TaxID=2919919 RepID=UPI001F4D9A07|nr:nitroreductase family protein [Atopomonas sediminilitoris]MCJ8169343.1 nitroreductase family protein [Atopomonas sediminilitoris]